MKEKEIRREGEGGRREGVRREREGGDEKGGEDGQKERGEGARDPPFLPFASFPFPSLPPVHLPLPPRAGEGAPRAAAAGRSRPQSPRRRAAAGSPLGSCYPPRSPRRLLSAGWAPGGRPPPLLPPPPRPCLDGAPPGGSQRRRAGSPPCVPESGWESFLAFFFFLGVSPAPSQPSSASPSPSSSSSSSSSRPRRARGRGLGSPGSIHRAPLGPPLGGAGKRKKGGKDSGRGRKGRERGRGGEGDGKRGTARASPGPDKPGLRRNPSDWLRNSPATPSAGRCSTFRRPATQRRRERPGCAPPLSPSSFSFPRACPPLGRSSLPPHFFPPSPASPLAARIPFPGVASRSREQRGATSPQRGGDKKQ